MIALSPMAGNVWLDPRYDSNAGFMTRVMAYTSLDGEVGLDVTPEVPNRASGTMPATATAALRGFGIDRVTGQRLSWLAAPVGATVMSPLSTLIAAHGSEAAVRVGLGLDEGSDALRSSIGLLTFNPVTGLKSSDPAIAHDAARLMSMNLELIALSSLLRYFSGDPTDVGFTLDTPMTNLAAVLRDTGKLRPTDPEMIKAALRNSPLKSLVVEGPQLDRRVQLFVNYFRALPATLRDEAEIRAWLYAFNFGVIPEFYDPDFQSMLSPVPSEVDIRDWQRAFLSAPVPVVADGPMGALDYRELNASSPTAYKAVLDGCGTAYQSLPTCNDNATTVGSTPYPLVVRLTAIRDVDPAALSVKLVDGTIEMTRVGSFTGLTYFSYTAADSSGKEVTGRVYVRVRPNY